MLTIFHKISLGKKNSNLISLKPLPASFPLCSTLRSFIRRKITRSVQVNVLCLRIFSGDGRSVYLTVRQMSDVRLVAVDLEGGAVTAHPERGLVLFDAVGDAILVARKFVERPTEEVALAWVREEFLMTTTVSTTTTTTTTTTTGRNTTEDPCETLHQELEVEKNG